MACVFLPVFAILFFASCVVTTPIDEPPLDCPPNEEYYKCSLEVCYKNCTNLKRPIPCPLISSNCFKPSCECIKGYLRNTKGVCIPSKDCYTNDDIVTDQEMIDVKDKYADH